MRDANLNYKDCSEMHSGSCRQMSCKCPTDRVHTFTDSLPMLVQCWYNGILNPVKLSVGLRRLSTDRDALQALCYCCHNNTSATIRQCRIYQVIFLVPTSISKTFKVDNLELFLSLDATVAEVDI